MRSFRLSFLLLLFLTTSLYAKTTFPELTGRVVDDAHILTPTTISVLTDELASFEKETTDQIVVVTVPTLDDEAIETYGYELGRFWGIGQKDKNNGALLIVAPKEHKVRIEVGYGLEGALTDARSSEIINSGILPRFKSGNLDGGVLFGAEAMIRVLKGQPINPPEDTIFLNNNPDKVIAGPVPYSEDAPMTIGRIIFIIIFVLFFIFFRFGLFFLPFGGFGGFGGGGFSSSGFGGFSGGGGSFGGGGASGSW